MEELKTRISISLNASCQKCETNCGPQSNVIHSGSPSRWITWTIWSQQRAGCYRGWSRPTDQNGTPHSRPLCGYESQGVPPWKSKVMEVQGLVSDLQPFYAQDHFMNFSTTQDPPRPFCWALPLPKSPKPLSKFDSDSQFIRPLCFISKAALLIHLEVSPPSGACVS